MNDFEELFLLDGFEEEEFLEIEELIDFNKFTHKF